MYLANRILASLIIGAWIASCPFTLADGPSKSSEAAQSGQNQSSNSSSRNVIEVPLTLDKAGMLHVNAEVEGTPMDLILDTGANTTAIDRAIAKRAGLQPGSKGTSSANHGTIEIENTHINRIKVPGLSAEAEAVIIDFSAFNGNRKSGGLTPIDGLIGSDFLADRTAVIDYRRLKLYLTFKQKQRKPVPDKFKGDRTIEIPLTLNKNRCLDVKVDIQGTTMTFLLDTGATQMILDQNLAKRMKLPIVQTGFKSASATGEHPLTQTTIDRIAIGKIVEKTGADLGDMEANNTTRQRMGDPLIGGLLDGAFLKRHEAIVDYGAKCLYLADKPSKEMPQSK